MTACVCVCVAQSRRIGLILRILLPAGHLTIFNWELLAVLNLLDLKHAALVLNEREC